MRQGKHFRIPEGPADVKRLWAGARALDPMNLPHWLTLEDVDVYRYLGTVSHADLALEEHAGYFAELDELETARVIVDPDPGDTRVHHLFVAAPQKEAIWTIGIQRGASPIALDEPVPVKNPVLTAAEVTDVPAVFVADPFLLRAGATWHMFFEVMNWHSYKGEIGHATSPDGWSWKYHRIVLSEEFHLSYPCVFEWAGDYYMIPECYQSQAVRLYRADSFPTGWTFVTKLLEGPYLADATPLRYQERWWLFVDTSDDMKNDTLRLFFADDLTGPWREHPHSPVIRGNPRSARPGGRVVAHGDRLIRFTQGSEPFYGTDVRAFAITELSPTRYREEECPGNPVLAPSGGGWNACGMHHLDAHPAGDGWLASVDGWRWG